MRDKGKAIASALKHLSHQMGGTLTPEAVVEAAADPKSVLHGCFEWDDSVAARLYRLDQARRLIRAQVTVAVTENERIQVQTYVRDPDVETHEQGYRRIDAGWDDDAKRAALVAKFQQAAGIMESARAMARFFELESDLDELIKQIEILRFRAGRSGPFEGRA